MSSDDDKSFMGRTSINVVTNTIRTVVMALIGLMLVPYYLDQLGTATYGVIPLATTMTSYVMLVCDSLTSATTRYATLAIRSGNDDEALSVFNTAFFGIVRICIFFLPLILALSYISPYVFSVPDGMDRDVQILFLCVLLASAMVSVSSAFECVYQAHNRLYLLYIIKTAYVLIQVGLIFLMFNVSTPSLTDVGVSYLVSAAIMFLLLFLLAKRDYPHLRLRPGMFSLQLFKSMGRLGFWSVVERVGSLLYIQISLVLINIYLGSTAEAGFAIVSSMISMVHTACYSVTSALNPLLYKCYADRDPEKMKEVSVTGIKIISLLFAFPVAVLMIFSPEILTTWVGEEHADLAVLLRIAFLGDIMFCAVSMINSVPVIYARAAPLGLTTLFLGIFNAVGAIVVLLFTDYGMEGVMWVWLFATSSLSVFISVYVARLIGVPMYTMLVPQIYGYVVCGGLTLVMYFLSKYIEVEPTWLYIIPFFVILFLIYLPIMFRVLMNGKDRSMVRASLPGAIARRIPEFLLR